MDDREAIRGEEAPDEWQPVEGMRIVPAETLFEGGLASFPDYWEHEQVPTARMRRAASSRT